MKRIVKKISVFLAAVAICATSLALIVLASDYEYNYTTSYNKNRKDSHEFDYGNASYGLEIISFPNFLFKIFE